MKNLGTGYIEAEYVAYEYENDKSTEKEHIHFWCGQYDYIITFGISCMMCKEANKN